jgi:hypothetical protein
VRAGGGQAAHQAGARSAVALVEHRERPLQQNIAGPSRGPADFEERSGVAECGICCGGCVTDVVCDVGGLLEGVSCLVWLAGAPARLAERAQ